MEARAVRVGGVVRLWTPVPYGAIVAAAARAGEVSDWTDVGPGDGRRTVAITQGLELRRRLFIVRPGASAPDVPGWNIERSDLRSWDGHGDCLSLLDVLEHLERHEALAVLERLERGYRMVVIFTPWGFMRQDPTTDPDLAADPSMWHRSGFEPNDFEKRGYITLAWPLYHPAAQVGAILAVKCAPAATNSVESAMLAAYSHLSRNTSLPRALGRWWLWKFRRSRRVVTPESR